MGQVAFAVLRRHFATFLENEPGTRLGEDPDALHDMRVTTRRVRAAIKLFEDVLPVRLVRARDELRWVADALGAVRDLDVQLERLEEWIGEADEEDREPLAGLRRILESEREEAREVLLEVLDSDRYQRLVTGFAGLLLRGPLRTSPASRVPAVVVGPDLASARHRKVRKATRRVGDEPVPERFHRLRIQGKRLRYALEFLSEVYGTEPGPLIKRLEKLQDHLGLLQDAVVAVARLRRLAAREDVSRTTVFAMGEVAERYRRQAADLQKTAPKAYRRVQGKRWKDLLRTMERVRAASGWTDRRSLLRPVASVGPPAAVAAATGGPAGVDPVSDSASGPVLILVRHAVAFPEDPARWPDDGRRHLTPEGERAFHEAARGLGRLTHAPGVVLASPFVRAWRTAEILQEEAGWPAPRPAEALQKGATVEEAVDAIRAQGGIAVVGLVGHEPNLTQLASTLLVGDASVVRMELDKGGALAISGRAGDPVRTTLWWLVTRAGLRSLGR